MSLLFVIYTTLRGPLGSVRAMASDRSHDTASAGGNDEHKAHDEIGEVRDELPEDLDRGFVGPYRFPDNVRRRITGTLYVLCGVAMLVGVQLAGSEAVLANTGITVCGILLILLGLYHWIAGRRFGVDENQSLALASAAVEFPVGHASAQLGWRGLLSRPTWRTLIFSAEDPPRQRALILVDAVDGRVLDSYSEDVPESERQAWPSAEIGTEAGTQASTETAQRPNDV